ncbi:MAG: hypothetical protein ACETWK_14850 [Candidatus Aminicenantaceae bacterium]
MKNRLFVLFVALYMVLWFVRIEAFTKTEDIEKMIKTASGVLLDRSSSRDEIRDALLQLLDAAIITMPQTDYSDEAKAKIEVAKHEFSKKSFFSEKGHQYLSLAYRLMNNGKKYQLPEEEIYPIERAVEYCKKLVNSAIASLKEGPDGHTTMLLLELVIMVVTPIPRTF